MRFSTWSGTRIGRRLAVVAAGATMAMTLAAPAVQAAPQRPVVPSDVPMRYVNLGDSYSAASGVMPRADGVSLLCAQSARNYAKIIAERFRYRYTDVSCGGAKTQDFFAAQYPGVPRQLDAVRRSTRLVTLAVGGNDGNVFARVVGTCAALAAARPGVYAPCRDVNGGSFAQEIRTQTYPALVAAFRAVRAAAPRATVAALNYPWITPAYPTSCPGFAIARGDIPYAHGIQATLNDAVKRAAEKTGVVLVDVAARSVGHDACQPVGSRWVEPLVPQGDITPVHPNALGALQMSRITARTLGLSRQPSSMRGARNAPR